MTYGIRAALIGGAALILASAGGVAAAAPPDNNDHHQTTTGHTSTPLNKGQTRGEAHAGPTHYQRVNEPTGWNNRPKTFNRTEYQHNYQAARSYKIGPYHRPSGWKSRHWTYGQVLPRAYWSSEYLIGDYWLFGLEVPPVGYEWVRDDTDALLVDINTGEILEVEYGVFA